MQFKMVVDLTQILKVTIGGYSVDVNEGVHIFGDDDFFVAKPF